MTIVAACRFPWGKMRALAEGTGGTEEALIFASDTRHTYRTGVIDVAAKIFPFVQSNVLIAYSGEAELAETCIELIGERTVLGGETSSDDVGRLAQGILSDRWPTRRVRDMQLIMFIGICNAQGAADLLKLGSESEFAPLSLYGAHAIGQSKACDTFLQRLDRSVEKRYERGAVVAEPRAWATIIGGALFETIEAQPENSTVGGKVQCYILDSKGIHGWGIARKRVEQKLEKVSLKHTDAQTYKEKWGKRPAAKHPMERLEVDNPTGGGPFATRL